MICRVDLPPDVTSVFLSPFVRHVAQFTSTFDAHSMIDQAATTMGLFSPADPQAVVLLKEYSRPTVASVEQRKRRKLRFRLLLLCPCRMRERKNSRPCRIGYLNWVGSCSEVRVNEP